MEYLTLQQYLPFTVLKRKIIASDFSRLDAVATVLTVYGIETVNTSTNRFHKYVATVLTVYGIETQRRT